MSTVRELGEFSLIERIARMIPSVPSVVEGIGDDCAVVRVADRTLLLSSDLFVEDVHFRRRYVKPDDLGWKAAAGCISDVAAMGGAPLFCLVSLACPADTETAYIEEMYRGISTLLARYGAAVVGGDTTQSPQGIIVDMAVVGQPVEKRFLRRKGARSGDLLAVTGYLGLAGATVHALENGLAAPAELTQRYFRPAPRVREGQWLCGRSVVHAMLDVSDGLVHDAKHLAEAGQLGVDIHPALLPRRPELEAYCLDHGLDPVERMLCGGEDYELAFAMSPDELDETLRAFHHEFRTAITVVGEFTDQWQGVRVGGQDTPLHGYEHFKH